MPYVVVGGVGFYERREVKDVLSYLRLVAESRGRGGLPAGPQRAAAGHRRQARSRRSSASRSRGTESSRGTRSRMVVDEALLPARATQPLARFRELVERPRARRRRG